MPQAYSAPCRPRKNVSRYQNTKIQVRRRVNSLLTIFVPDSSRLCAHSSSIKFSEAAIRGTSSKVTIKQFRTSSQGVKTLRRLVDEFHDMRYLHHANLINYIDLFQHESDIWVVLEGIHKTISLKKVISANVSRDAGLKESFIATVLRNVGQALHYLHRHAINHGNINSEEILLSYIGKSILVRLSEILTELRLKSL